MAICIMLFINRLHIWRDHLNFLSQRNLQTHENTLISLQVHIPLQITEIIAYIHNVFTKKTSMFMEDKQSAFLSPSPQHWDIDPDFLIYQECRSCSAKQTWSLKNDQNEKATLTSLRKLLIITQFHSTCWET